MSGTLSRGDDFDPNDSEESPEDGQAPRAQRGHRRSRQSQNRNRSRGRNAGHRPLPTVEELIHTLNSLPKLIALGILQPAQANAIRSMIDSMLRALNSGNGRADSGRGPILPIDRLRELLDVHPEFADLLEPLLGDDVLAQLFGDEDAADADHDADFDGDNESAANDPNAEGDAAHDEP